MHIDTEIHPVVVEIDDREYEVASKTVDIAERLQKAEMSATKSGKLAFELWREHLEILLGRAAVKDLFPNGKNENLDRMEAIYYGVMDAFNFNARDRHEARRKASVSEVEDIADALKPLGELLSLLKSAPTANVSQFPTIKRPQ